MRIKKKPGGLEGIVAGQTAISTVGKEGVGLTYRGYSINDLAERATFEEVAYLLLYGQLPTRDELTGYRKKLASLRGLPAPLKTTLELLPADTQPMDVLRTGCSTLGCLEPEGRDRDQYAVANRLLAAFPSMLLYWHQFHKQGRRIETQTSDQSIAAHFLHLLQGAPPDASHERALDSSLILYAEHEFNASTFATRITTSTLADFYSAITSGIGTLRGPLHGGANEEAMAFVERFKNPDEAEAGVKKMLASKEKIMGFGHRVYKTSDPRSGVIKNLAKKLAEGGGRLSRFSSGSKPLCGGKKNSSPTSISTARRLIAFAAFPLRCSRRCSSLPAPPAGPLTSWNNAPTTASSGPPPNTSARRPGRLFRLTNAET